MARLHHRARNGSEARRRAAVIHLPFMQVNNGNPGGFQDMEPVWNAYGFHMADVWQFLWLSQRTPGLVTKVLSRAAPRGMRGDVCRADQPSDGGGGEFGEHLFKRDAQGHVDVVHRDGQAEVH
ncbi:hypothetical protein SAMN06265370_10557 [Puniceibacterium sediminis]|uniref:Uncharacterized protein n=1 Tax=Puniceibacterium sediminis TaxID=1608407 RepID=A0A238WB14_9RHOB|nr:hypothetical protein SAMN06265370_10557 [Puniceibacterium sediminis]